MKRLSLKIERLTELSAGELERAVGGTWTSTPACIVSFDPRGCVTSLCTLVYPHCIQTS